MTWFIISVIIYAAVILQFLYLIHRETERDVRDRTPVPEEELKAKRNMARQAKLRGISAQGIQPGSGGVSKVNGCLFIFILMFYMAAVVAVPCLIALLVQKAMIPAGYTALKADILVFTYGAAGAFGFCVLYMLPLASEKLNGAFERKFGKENMKTHLTKHSARIIKTIVLFMFIVTFPFFSFGLNTYACYNEDRIIYRSFFSITETATEYSEVQQVERSIRRQDNGKITSMSYVITLSDGKTIDPLFDGEDQTLSYIVQTYEIHGYIKAEKPELFTDFVDVSVSDIRTFLRKHDEAAIQKVLFIFDIE